MDVDRRHRWFHRREPAAPAVSDTRPVPDAAPAVDTAAALRRLRDYLYVQVRSGAYDRAGLRRLSLEAAAAETTDQALADELARRVVSDEIEAWRSDAERWTARTDCDRLDAALERVSATGALVLAGMTDQASLSESLRIRGAECGCVAYLVTDIWRAIDSGTLHLRVLDGDGPIVRRDDPLVVEVVDALVDHGLLASTLRDGRGVDVAMVWRRRPQF